jgi:hypothetical protein
MRDFSFWVRWLVVVGWILIGFGFALAFLNRTWLFDVAFNRRIDPAFWPGGAAPAELESFQAWIYGVLGATVAGWGIFVVLLSKNPLKNRERWAWTCLFFGFTLWFIVDTSISAYFGVYFNVVFNCALAALVYVPLAATRSQLGQKRRPSGLM